MPSAKEKTKPVHPKIASAWKLSKGAIDVLWKHRKHFGIILFFYAIAYVIAVTSSGSLANASTLLNHYNSIYQGINGHIVSGVKTYISLLGSLTDTNAPINGGYQLVLFISLSLVVIWSIEAFAKKKKISARDAFYNSAAPLIPFFLILLVIGLDFIPLLIAVGLYNLVIVNGVAIGAGEIALWDFIFLLLAILSLYLATSTFIALYIVAEGKTRPMAALKKARSLVKGRRIIVFGRMLFMPIAILIAAGIIMLPFILIVPSIAQALLFVLSLVALMLAHSYMYSLSREVNK